MPIQGRLLKGDRRLIRTVIFISYYRPVICHESVLIDSKCMYVCTCPFENVFRELKWTKVASQNLYNWTTSNFIQVTSVLSAFLRSLSFSRLCSCRKWRGIISPKNGNFQRCYWRKDRRYEKLIRHFRAYVLKRAKKLVMKVSVYTSRPQIIRRCISLLIHNIFKKCGGWIWNLALSWAGKLRWWQWLLHKSSDKNCISHWALYFT